MSWSELLEMLRVSFEEFLKSCPKLARLCLLSMERSENTFSWPTWSQRRLCGQASWRWWWLVSTDKKLVFDLSSLYDRWESNTKISHRGSSKEIVIDDLICGRTTVQLDCKAQCDLLLIATLLAVALGHWSEENELHPLSFIGIRGRGIMILDDLLGNSCSDNSQFHLKSGSLSGLFEKSFVSHSFSISPIKSLILFDFSYSKSCN